MMLLLGNQLLLAKVILKPVAELADTINLIIVWDFFVDRVAHVTEDFRNPKHKQ
jgi:hypothetical protein